MSVPIKQCHCQKCGHDWWPNKPGRPFACPECHNPRWDQGPKKPGGRGRTSAIAAAEDADREMGIDQSYKD